MIKQVLMILLSQLSLSLKKKNKPKTTIKETNYVVLSYLSHNIFYYKSLEHLLCSFLCILITILNFFKGRVHISVYWTIYWMIECTDLSVIVHVIIKENSLHWVCLKTKGFLSVASIKLQKATLALFRKNKGQYSISCQW